jgi:hypothetical protein
MIEKRENATPTSERDDADIESTRAWSRRAKERAEAGQARDDSEWAKSKIEELRRSRSTQ